MSSASGTLKMVFTTLEIADVVGKSGSLSCFDSSPKPLSPSHGTFDCCKRDVRQKAGRRNNTCECWPNGLLRVSRCLFEVRLFLAGLVSLSAVAGALGASSLRIAADVTSREVPSSLDELPVGVFDFQSF